MTCARAIAQGDRARVSRLLETAPELAMEGLAVGATRHGGEAYFLDEIDHHVYAGDTALHIAAAAYEADLVRELVAAGANVAAANRRGAQPLHYAVDGIPGSTAWQLARWTTGRSGSGSAAARGQQQEILELLRAAGGGDASPEGS